MLCHVSASLGILCLGLRVCGQADTAGAASVTCRRGHSVPGHRPVCSPLALHAAGTLSFCHHLFAFTTLPGINKYFWYMKRNRTTTKKRQGENLEGKAFECSCLSEPLSLGSLGTSTHHRWLSGPGPARGPWGSAWSLWSSSGGECSTLNPSQAFSYSSILSPVTLTTSL